MFDGRPSVLCWRAVRVGESAGEKEQGQEYGADVLVYGGTSVL